MSDTGRPGPERPAGPPTPPISSWQATQQKPPTAPIPASRARRPPDARRPRRHRAARDRAGPGSARVGPASLADPGDHRRRRGHRRRDRHRAGHELRRRHRGRPAGRRDDHPAALPDADRRARRPARDHGVRRRPADDRAPVRARDVGRGPRVAGRRRHRGLHRDVHRRRLRHGHRPLRPVGDARGGRRRSPRRSSPRSRPRPTPRPVGLDRPARPSRRAATSPPAGPWRARYSIADAGDGTGVAVWVNGTTVFQATAPVADIVDFYNAFPL